MDGDRRVSPYPADYGAVLEERCELPKRVCGGAPSKNWFRCFLSLKERPHVKKYLGLLSRCHFCATKLTKFDVMGILAFAYTCLIIY